MNKQRSAQFTLRSMINSVTLRSWVEIVNRNPLRQAVTSSYQGWSPDWQENTNSRPKFMARVMDNSNGNYIAPNNDATLKLIWNGYEVAFDDVTGLSTGLMDDGQLTMASLYAGKIKKTTGTLSGQTVVYFEIVDNIFSTLNPDSDTFRIEGTVTVNDVNLTFCTDEREVEVIIYSPGATAYHVDMISEDISEHTEGGTTSVYGQVFARLVDLSTGTPITNVTPSWHNMDGTAEGSALTSDTSYTINNTADSNGWFRLRVINPNVVNGSELFMAAFTVGGNTYKGYSPMSDLTDNFFVQYEITGDVTNGWVNDSDNAIAVVNISICDAEGNTLSGKGLYPNLYVKTRTGGDSVSSLYYSCSDSAGQLKVTNAQMKTFGGLLTGYVSLDTAAASPNPYVGTDPSLTI